MTESSSDAGVISVLIERFEEQRLPRALEMKERVDRGEKLSDIDLAFLKEVFADAQNMKTYIDKFPEYQSVAAQAMSLYSDISQKALENEEGT
jgi:hypothetical protein